MEDAKTWLAKQNPNIQMVFDTASLLLRKWNEINGDPEKMMHLLWLRMRLGNEEMFIVTATFLHIAHGDHPDWPEGISTFSRESTRYLVPMFRSILAWCNITGLRSLMPGYRPNITDLRGTVVTLSILPALPPQQRREIEEDMSDYLARMPHVSIIDTVVEADAQQMLDSGEVSTRHPAHRFLTQVVRHAPDSREIPGRCAELVARLGLT